MDPFELNSVEVRGSKTEGEGLFTKRPIMKGELVCFYSGFLLHSDAIINPLNRKLGKLKDTGSAEEFYYRK